MEKRFLNIKANEFKLGFGTVTTAMGNKMYDIACNIILSNLSGTKPILTAIYQASEILIGVLINAFGGVFADRAKDKRKIMVMTDLLCGLLCLVLAFFTNSIYLVYGIIIVNVGLAIFSSFNSPSTSAIIKFAIEKERIASYNSAIKILREIIKVVSPLFSLYLLSYTSFRVVILFNAATFLVSAFMESTLVIAPHELKAKSSSVLADIKEGFIYIYQHKSLLLILLIASFFNFFLAGYELFLPYTKNLFTDPAINPYAIFRSAESIGGILGALLAFKLHKHKIDRMILFLGLAGIAFVFFYFSIPLNMIWLSSIPVAIYSGMVSLFNIVFMTNVQTETDSNYIGRVFSVIFTIAILFMPVGSFIFTALFDTSSSLPFLVVGICVILTAIFGYIYYLQINKSSR